MDKLEIERDYTYRIKGVGDFHIHFDFECLNIFIKDSYRATKRSQIKEVIKYIRSLDAFEIIKSIGYRRTECSMNNEWIAHNYLYYKNIRQIQTGSVDIDQKESFWRRLGYWVLSKFYREPK